MIGVWVLIEQDLVIIFGIVSHSTTSQAGKGQQFNMAKDLWNKINSNPHVQDI